MSKELEQFDSLKADIALFVAPVKSLKVSDFKSSANAIEAGKQLKHLLKQVEDKRKSLVKPLNDQVDLINDHAKNIKQPIESATAHISAELNRFATEQEKIKQEELRRAELLRVEQEKKAEEERRKLLIAQEEKRLAELKALEEAEAAVDSMFGPSEDSFRSMEQSRRALEEKNERERLETEARLEREAAVRANQSRAAEFDIKQNQIKNARKTWKVEVVDINLVPKEYLIISLNQAMALASARAGNTTIPGLKFSQEISVSLGSKTYVPQRAIETEENVGT